VSGVMTVVAKDMRLAWRDRAGWLSAASFAILAVLTYSFAFDLAQRDVIPLLPGVLWTTFLFAGIFAGGASFQREIEDGTFDAMVLSPVSPVAVYVGKALSNLVALLVIQFALLALGSVMFNTLLLTPLLAAIVVIGTIGYVALTTLLSTMGSRMRGRAVLLPVMVLPLLVPLLIGATRATSAALGMEAGGAPWLLLMTVFAFWSMLLSVILFPLAVER
jgi:heme exporter protein B